MLWDVFGASLDRVPIEEVHKLSQAEIDAFTCLRHHAVERSLALATKSGVPSAKVRDNLGDSENALLSRIDTAARACQTVPELAAVEALRH